MYNFIILAAGNGARMNSNIPKVLHKIKNETMLEISVNLAKKFKDQNNKIILVLSNRIVNEFKEYIPEDVDFVIQEEQLGTGHAVKIGLQKINKNNAKTIIMYADNPLLKLETVQNMFKELDISNLIALGFILEIENKYGKMLLEKTAFFGIGEILDLYGIKEVKEYKNNEVQPKICNSGFIALRTDDLIENIEKITNKNTAQEYYLTEIIEILIKQDKKASCLICENEEVYGVNTPEELRIAEEIYNKKEIKIPTNNTNNFLLEIYSEEIPSRLQEELLKFIEESSQILLSRHIKIEEFIFKTFIGVNRVIISIQNLKDEYQITKEGIKGPKIDLKEEIIDKFCQKNKIQKSNLTQKDEYYYTKDELKIARTEEILKAFVFDILIEISENFFKKSKKENGILLENSIIKWIRPIRNILCLFNNRILEFEIGNLKTNNRTYLHKQIFFGQEIKISNANIEEYKDILKKGQIVIHRNEKREMIFKQIEVLNQQNLIYNEIIIKEIIGITDYPFIQEGKIEDKYKVLPKELIVLTLESNQKYIMLKENINSDKISTKFLIAIDGEREKGEILNNIISGYEQVANNRLSDAFFYYDLDKNTSIIELENKLKNVSFYKNITYYEFIEKIQNLAKNILNEKNKSNYFEILKKLIRFSKLDIVMKTINEFPELQGIIAGVYFKNNTNSEDFSFIIRRQYERVEKKNEIKEIECISYYLFILIERTTSINILWENEKPTGSGDPYGIKHKLYDIVNIILDISRIEHFQDFRYESYNILKTLPKEAQERMIEFYLKELTSDTTERNKIMKYILEQKDVVNFILYNFSEIEQLIFNS